MSLSAKDHKAIKWYCETNNVKPQLSAPPQMYFTDSKGDAITKDLGGIILEYNAWNEDDKKVRARERKNAANAKNSIRLV